MFATDKDKKTVRILVRFKDGVVVRHDNRPLPEIKEGALGEFVIPAFSLVNEAERHQLESESFVELLPSGSQLFIGLNLEALRAKDGKKLYKSEDLKIGHGYSFAEVRLLEPLKLHYRGGSKDPCLEPCKCLIPALDSFKAKSLNDAFTRLSTKYETNRISHVGNVFTRVFFKRDGWWLSLNEARGYPIAQ